MFLFYVYGTDGNINAVFRAGFSRKIETIPLFPIISGRAKAGDSCLKSRSRITHSRYRRHHQQKRHKDQKNTCAQDKQIFNQPVSFNKSDVNQDSNPQPNKKANYITQNKAIDIPILIRLISWIGYICIPKQNDDMAQCSKKTKSSSTSKYPSILSCPFVHGT